MITACIEPNHALTTIAYVMSMCLAALSEVVVCVFGIKHPTSALCCVPPNNVTLRGTFCSPISPVLTCGPLRLPAWPVCVLARNMVVSLRENSNPRRTTGCTESDLRIAMTDTRSPGPKHVRWRSTVRCTPSWLTVRDSACAYTGHVEWSSCLSIMIVVAWDVTTVLRRRKKPLQMASQLTRLKV